VTELSPPEGMCKEVSAVDVKKSSPQYGGRRRHE
jgi:hypothetical protein